MKTRIKNNLKLGLVAIFMLSIGMVSAQQTTGNVTKTEDAGHSRVLNGTVRVIDNKGTKKFLQVKNGLTLLTDTAPDGGIISTWQLGGTLSDNTTITLNDGTTDHEFVIDGKNFKVNGVEQKPTATAPAASGDLNTSGFTLLVRDEATGTIQKMLATDLITSGQTVFTATAAQTTYDVTAGAPAMAGSQIPLPDYSKVWVYRNGAKLVANVDYTIAGSVVTLVPNTSAPNDWTVYAGDVIEIQYIK